MGPPRRVGHDKHVLLLSFVRPPLGTSAKISILNPLGFFWQSLTLRKQNRTLSLWREI
jgi:hypothetical protein